jgi:Na+-transporting methylmalonyl-CoA/oxaloacetate decarboxylase gamma subunit
MESLISALSAYGITIVFAMLIASIIPLLGSFVKMLKLDSEETVNVPVPTSNFEKEEESIAVAIAIAFSQRR